MSCCLVRPKTQTISYFSSYFSTHSYYPNLLILTSLALRNLLIIYIRFITPAFSHSATDDFADHSANYSERHSEKHCEKHFKTDLESQPKMPTAAPTPVLDLALLPILIQHYPEHRLLYCRLCTTVVFLKGLSRQLRDIHKVCAATR